VSDPIAARERDVERNREQLAQTVDALHAKLDVKSKAQARARDVKARVAPDGRPDPRVVAGTVAAVALVVALVLWRRS
jgi:type VI protein secretion system component VasF